MISINSEPNKISAAYRPIVFDVEITNNPPVAYCDIYFDGIYYKTLSKTFPYTLNIYRFDISDACQEYLSSDLPPINGNNQNMPENHFLQCYCKFRSSSINGDGFIQQQEPIPVQATKTNSASEGGGLQSQSFFVINAVLQHKNNQNIVTHLKSFHNYGNEVLVLSHRPENYKICKNNSDFLSVFTGANLNCIKVTVKRKDGVITEYQKCNSWKGVNMVCLKDGDGKNTGYKNYTTLEMHDWSNQSTGITKPNTEGTDGYITPVYDDDSCPLVIMEPCPKVTDLTFTENTENLEPYMIRSFNFVWTKTPGKTYRLEFQRNGISGGFYDNPDVNDNNPVLVHGITGDKVRVVTICGENNEINSDWYDLSQQTSNSRVYITDYSPPNSENGSNISYKLHVEDEDFTGYIITVLDVNARAGDVYSAESSFTPSGMGVSYTSGNLNNMEKAMPITIPIGVYDCWINLYVDWNPVGQPFEVQSYIIYSATDQYEDEITSARAWRTFYFDAP